MKVSKFSELIFKAYCCKAEGHGKSLFLSSLLAHENHFDMLS